MDDINDCSFAYGDGDVLKRNEEGDDGWSGGGGSRRASLGSQAPPKGSRVEEDVSIQGQGVDVGGCWQATRAPRRQGRAAAFLLFFSSCFTYPKTRSEAASASGRRLW